MSEVLCTTGMCKYSLVKGVAKRIENGEVFFFLIIEVTVALGDKFTHSYFDDLFISF